MMKDNLGIIVFKVIEGESLGDTLGKGRVLSLENLGMKGSEESKV